MDKILHVIVSCLILTACNSSRNTVSSNFIMPNEDYYVVKAKVDSVTYRPDTGTNIIIATCRYGTIALLPEMYRPPINYSHQTVDPGITVEPGKSYMFAVDAGSGFINDVSSDPIYKQNHIYGPYPVKNVEDMKVYPIDENMRDSGRGYTLKLESQDKHYKLSESTKEKLNKIISDGNKELLVNP